MTFTVSANVDLTATFTTQTEPGLFNVVTGVVGGGEVAMTPAGPFVGGQSTLLTALPHLGWQFERWSGDIGGYQNPLTLEVNGDTEVTALFALAPHIPTLTLEVANVGQGTVTVDPSGPYLAGQPITLTATAASDWSFAGWSGGLAGSANPFVMTIISNTAVTANFSQVANSKQLSVTVAVQGEGLVEASPAGPYEQEQLVTLSATAKPGWRFAGWSGDQNSLLNPYSFAIQTATTVTATFEPLELTLAVVGSGTVLRDPAGPYLVGQMITVTAQPEAGWKFAGWSGGIAGSRNPYPLTVTQSLLVTATFAHNGNSAGITLVLSTRGDGLAEAQPSAPYQPGQQITLMAVAAPGQCFEGWIGDLTSQENPYLLTLVGDQSITAQFGPCPLFLPVISSP
jgi:hypothetical protein